MKSKTNSRRKFIRESAIAATGVGLYSSNFAVEHEKNYLRKSMSNKRVGESVLFSFDDFNIPRKRNLELTLVQAVKYPKNPVLRRGPSGSHDHGHAILYGTVIKVGEKFRMWYLGMAETEIGSDYQSPKYWRPMCYAESLDGIEWTKPNLGLVEFNGNKKNNICQIIGIPNYLTLVDDFLSILYEPEDPDPSCRYKAAFITHSLKSEVLNLSKDEARGRICLAVCATSSDGLSWKLVEGTPINKSGEHFEVSSVYHFGGSYYATGQGLAPFGWRPNGEGTGRIMVGYKSPNFKDWNETRFLAFARGAQFMESNLTEETHMGAGIWNRDNVLIGLYGMWHGPKEKPPKGVVFTLGTHVDLGLIVSNDGIHFREPVPDFKIIPRGKEGEWDHIAVLQGNAFVNVGDKTMIWYSSWDTSGRLRSMEIGLATLRRDGFGFLSSKHDNNEAELITSVLKADRDEILILNVDGVSPEHPLYIELLDENDISFPKYSENQAAIVNKNGTEVRVSWPQSNYLPNNKEFAIKIKFPKKSKARVYAMYIRNIKS